jgi:AbrB family looped-hinge helix DNA binding protein
MLREFVMDATVVTRKGQVTIPKSLRQQLGLQHGSKVEFSLVGDHVEMRISGAAPDPVAGGFGMLKSRRAAIPADFDPATLLKP